MLVCTEVGIVQHGVGIEDAHHADLVEIESLADHLRTDEDIGTSGAEVTDDTLIGIVCTGGIEVHTGHTGFGEDLTHLLLNLLRTKALRTEVGTATAGTLRGNLISIAAIVAGQLVQLPVERQRHVTMLAVGHPSALTAFYHGGEATTVLEQDDLLTTFQGLAHAS